LHRIWTTACLRRLEMGRKGCGLVYDMESLYRKTTTLPRGLTDEDVPPAVVHYRRGKLMDSESVAILDPKFFVFLCHTAESGDFTELSTTMSHKVAGIIAVFVALTFAVYGIDTLIYRSLLRGLRTAASRPIVGTECH
jgi:hypothetical protein